eukprot:Gregarina_sp_Pseudo_9__708@NODE_1450_length_1590_cov_24_599613_g1347_i0_p1_GENE_NODE_1450_length_1590_cov_24_599613_g1347_i0NODE_1450_length_1590_cov_24_599613_g1347_i0_p1_ORF_typecomplete_len278_score90_72_NODE_1450_length_1590_cov_24_599613_g1347_i053886
MRWWFLLGCCVEATVYVIKNLRANVPAIRGDPVPCELALVGLTAEPEWLTVFYAIRAAPRYCRYVFDFHTVGFESPASAEVCKFDNFFIFGVTPFYNAEVEFFRFGVPESGILRVQFIKRAEQNCYFLLAGSEKVDFRAGALCGFPSGLRDTLLDPGNALMVPRWLRPASACVLPAFEQPPAEESYTASMCSKMESCYIVPKGAQALDIPFPTAAKLGTYIVAFNLDTSSLEQCGSGVQYLTYLDVVTSAEIALFPDTAVSLWETASLSLLLVASLV